MLSLPPGHRALRDACLFGIGSQVFLIVVSFIMAPVTILGVSVPALVRGVSLYLLLSIGISFATPLSNEEKLEQVLFFSRVMAIWSFVGGMIAFFLL